MQKEIIINAAANQHRIAITEEGRLAELFVESDERARMVGDIFLGTVAKVMPGIQACFVDIGLEQDAFLHYSDISKAFRDTDASDTDGRHPHMTPDVEAETDQKDEKKGGDKKDRRRRPPRHSGRIRLQRGQEIVVQIFKEPVGTKGVRVTSEISLPGRFIVLMPYDSMIGVSRKISNFKEKRRLRRIAQSILPPGFGVIIRTVAQGRDEEVLREDLISLVEAWREVERTIRKSKAPALVYKDMNATSSVIRDLFSEEVTRVAVDTREMYQEIRSYVNLVAPHKVNAIEFWRGNVPIFDKYEIEKQIEQSMHRKVWLKSGGYLIIEHTEAMKVIDVNSGRFAGKADQEANSLRTNLEAAREIARQVRLRDLGGIIVIDFIDMDHDEYNRKLFEEMRKEMRRDRAKYTILPVSDFGLMQITRQRVRESVQMSFSEDCPTCQGIGMVQSKTSVLTIMERWLRRFRLESKEVRLQLTVHPALAAFLTEGSSPHLTKLMLQFFVRIKVLTDPNMAIDAFRFVSVRRKQDVTSRYLG